MYNTDIPNREELPSTAKLVRSTIIAAIVALVLLVTVVMPAEYALDPTGAGRLLGLTEMGEIKEQLAEEAAADEAAQMVAVQSSVDQKTPEVKEPVVDEAVEEPSPSPEVEVAPAEPAPEPEIAEPQWQDEVRVVSHREKAQSSNSPWRKVLQPGSPGCLRVALSTSIPMVMEAASQFLTKKAGAFRKMRVSLWLHSPATMAGFSETGTTTTSPSC